MSWELGRLYSTCVCVDIDIYMYGWMSTHPCMRTDLILDVSQSDLRVRKSKGVAAPALVNVKTDWEYSLQTLHKY